MKKVIVVFAMLFGLTALAQNQKTAKKQTLTPEQQTTIRLKKMVLALDLTASQTAKMKPIIEEQVQRRIKNKQERQANKKESLNSNSTLRYEKQIKRLDAQIALNKQVKQFLDQEQYAQWKKLQMHKSKRGRKREGKAKK